MSAAVFDETANRDSLMALASAARTEAEYARLVCQSNKLLPKDRQRPAQAIFRARQTVAAAARLAVADFGNTCERWDGTIPTATVIDPDQLRREPARGYAVAQFWRTTTQRPVTTEWAQTWSRRAAHRLLRENADRNCEIVRDAGGCYYAASAWRALRLRPTVQPAPDCGHVLRAALSTYGVEAFSNVGGGISNVTVPLESGPDESVTGVHIVIAAGETVSRHPLDNDEPLTAWVCDDYGNPIGRDPLYCGDGADLALDAAACARAVAAWIASHPR